MGEWGQGLRRVARGAYPQAEVFASGQTSPWDGIQQGASLLSRASYLYRGRPGEGTASSTTDRGSLCRHTDGENNIYICMYIYISDALFCFRPDYSQWWRHVTETIWICEVVNIWCRSDHMWTDSYFPALIKNYWNKYTNIEISPCITFVEFTRLRTFNEVEAVPPDATGLKIVTLSTEDKEVSFIFHRKMNNLMYCI